MRGTRSGSRGGAAGDAVGAAVIDGLKRLLGGGNGRAQAPAGRRSEASRAGAARWSRQGLVLAAALALACMAVVGAWQSLRAWREARQALLALAAERAEALDAARRLEALDASLARSRRELAALEASLPARDGMPAVLRLLERLAEKGGVTWSSYRAGGPAALGGGGPGTPGGSPGAVPGGGAPPGPAPAAEPSPYAVLPLTLEFAGPRDRLLSLLATLERQLPAYVVTRVDLAAGHEGTQRLVLAGRLYLRNR